MAESAAGSGLTKSGSGTLVLPTANTYSGLTSVDAGVLQVTADGALGAAAGGATVKSGATLEFAGAFDYLTPEPLTLSGPGAAGQGALNSINGNTRLAAPIVLAGPATIGSGTAGSKLTLDGEVSVGGPLTFAGAGDIDVAGHLSDGAVAGLLEGMLTGCQNTGAQPANSGIRLLPRAGEQYRSAGDIWGDNQTWVYTGQFYVPAGVTTVAFAGNIDDAWYLKFDGAVYHDWAWGGHTGAISVTPDTWHDIELRFTNGGGGAGAVGGNNWAGSLPDTATYPNPPWAKGFGYALNPANPSSDNANDYLAPIDNGAMNLFRVSGGVLTKTGSGTLTLSGANTAAGPTTVSQGTLLVNGSLDHSPVTVQTGATLGGSGSSGPVTVAAGGNLSPGSSPGVYTSNGNYVQNGTLTLEVLDAAGGPGVGYDQVKVLGSGSVTLGGASVLALSYTGAAGAFNPAAGQVFTLIANDGAAPGDTTGTFSNYPAEGSPVTLDGKTLKLYYHGGDGNDVVLVAPWPLPVLSTISPASAVAGSQGNSEIILTGSDFAPSSKVKWNGTTDLATTYDTSGQLRATIPASLLATVQTAQITVVTPEPGGGTSSVLAFFVTEAAAGVTGQDVTSGDNPLASFGPATAQAAGSGLLAVAEYGANPGGIPTFHASGTYFDVYVAPGNSFSQVTIVACTLNGGTKLYWSGHGHLNLGAGQPAKLR